MKPSAYRSAWTPLEKVATIAYLFMRAARILAHPGPGLAGAGWRISKVMGIQDFVLVPGFAPAAPDAAKAMPGLVGAAAMTNEEKRELVALLERLRQEHRDLDAAIEALETSPGSDRLQIQRLKKRKLILRDRIIAIEDQLTPDISA
jgi:hypothetical protein